MEGRVAVGFVFFRGEALEARCRFLGLFFDVAKHEALNTVMDWRRELVRRHM